MVLRVIWGVLGEEEGGLGGFGEGFWEVFGRVFGRVLGRFW